MKLARAASLLLSGLSLTAHAQVNEPCYPWRTTVSALPFDTPPIQGNSPEEVCRALVARSSPYFFNGGGVRVDLVYTGIDDRSGGQGTGYWCNYDRVAINVADGSPSPGESGPWGRDGVVRQVCEAVTSNACGAGNPTDPALGIKTETHTDYAGAGAHPIDFVRTYRSQGMTPSSADSTRRWQHTYARSLELRMQPYGDVMGLIARRADGTGVLFSQVAPATWRTIGATKDQITELRDASNVLTGFMYKVFDDDSTETYSPAGQLLNVRARNGWVTTLIYSDATTPSTVAPAPGLLIGVRNHFGRELRFTYDTHGRLAELLPPGAIAGSGAGTDASPIRYQYDEPGSLAVGVSPEGQLTSVTWQDGSVRRYHYENATWPQALTGITDEAGVRWATYTYDNQGRVTRSEHVGGTDRVDFSYYSWQEERRTTVTTYGATGPVSSVYDFATDWAKGHRTVKSVSAPCALCGSTAQGTSYSTAGDKTREIAHDGTITFYKYDAKGRDTERATFPASFSTATTRPALANATKVVSTKWHASFNLPTQVAEPNKLTTNTYNAKAMLTGQSWTATTDATGAAKFNALKSGSTYATGWGYNANSLATSIVTRETAAGATTAVETGRRTFTYDVGGNVTKSTDITLGSSVSVSAINPSGRPTAGTSAGSSFGLKYGSTGKPTAFTLAAQSPTQFSYAQNGALASIRGADGSILYLDPPAGAAQVAPQSQATTASTTAASAASTVPGQVSGSASACLAVGAAPFAGRSCCKDTPCQVVCTGVPGYAPVFCNRVEYATGSGWRTTNFGLYSWLDRPFNFIGRFSCLEFDTLLGESRCSNGQCLTSTSR
jgi:YD repeat-containing protein